jgi:hypothetical protein
LAVFFETRARVGASRSCEGRRRPRLGVPHRPPRWRSRTTR